MFIGISKLVRPECELFLKEETGVQTTLCRLLSSSHIWHNPIHVKHPCEVLCFTDSQILPTYWIENGKMESSLRV